MNIAQIEKNLENLIKNISNETFIYDLLLAYSVPKSTIVRLQKGTSNLSKIDNQVILKKKLFFQEILNKDDLHLIIDDIKKNPNTHKHEPRFIVVTDYSTILAVDTKTNETLDIDVKELPKHCTFFLPWAGMEKTQNKDENPADIKAAEKMARLYDEILKNNPTKDKAEIHALNIFLSRILFCFFSEDTGIFEQGLFTTSIGSHTQLDGSDLNSYLKTLFKILNEQNRDSYPAHLQKFPYVNGGLFAEEYPIPVFSRQSRKIIIECGELDWSQINPDIFGSMIQAVVDPEHRGNLGMHYTSVPNIMKVIEPLFLNDIQEEFEKNKTEPSKLEKLLLRIKKIRIFDPACGSGNFLIIAYKELRKLEIKILKQLQSLSPKWSDDKTLIMSSIRLSQFYGIEIDDFAHEIAILSLWLAEHQMNVQFRNTFGTSKPALPLKDGGNISRSNAILINWLKVCPKDNEKETYILSNPPYLGARLQNDEQKYDMKITFDNVLDGYNNLDYISCWFLKAAHYIKNLNAKFAFVSTNSICQGSQIALLWPLIISDNLEIFFAHQSFKWSNNAKFNAGVICVIIGVRNKDKGNKFIYKDNLKYEAKNISCYLTDNYSTFVESRKQTISKIPKMSFGNMPNDGGNLILSKQEKDLLLKSNPEAGKFIRLLLGSQEYIRGEKRWCLWINPMNVNEAQNIPFIMDRINKVKSYRLMSKRAATKKLALTPYRFGEIRHKDSNQIIIPSVSSDKRAYIPIGFLDNNTIVSNLGLVIYDAEPWTLSLLTSKMHMIWVNAVCGRLGIGIRYSIEMCYNTFPFPELTDKQKEELTLYACNVIDAREYHSEKTMAELYDPDKMPVNLSEAHKNLDVAIERCYRSKPFNSDEERLEYLFKLYEEMINKNNGGLL